MHRRRAMQTISVSGGHIEHTTPSNSVGHHIYSVFDAAGERVASGEVLGLTDRVTESLASIAETVLRGLPSPPKPLRLDLGMLATRLIRRARHEAGPAGALHIGAGLVPGLTREEVQAIVADDARLVEDGLGGLVIDRAPRARGIGEAWSRHKMEEWRKARAIWQSNDAVVPPNRCVGIRGCDESGGCGGPGCPALGSGR